MNEPILTDYDICMNTPVGVKKGRLTVNRCSDVISGILNILKHNQPFEGKIDAEGNCEIKGTLITLLRTVNFVATGKIMSGSLSLSFKDGSHILKITGKAHRP